MNPLERLRFLYVAWFRDLTQPPEDEDYEWCACFMIQAVAKDEAQKWGDNLARSYSQRVHSEVFLKSQIEDEGTAAADSGDLSELPVVQAGRYASDEEIGW